MKVLIVGGGGREHALAWKIAKNKSVKKIYCAPGNGGISRIAECLPIKAMDIKGIVDFSVENKLDLVVVSPDDPLAAGMVDALQDAGIRAFGPVKDAAIIESSKSFSKNLMKKYGIPTAEYDIYDNPDDALKSLRHRKYPLVIKADGLAAGKGVIIAQTYDIAAKAIHDIMRNRIFGEAGNKVILEEFLTGMEVTVLSFTDGKTLVPMVSSQDHKKAYDYDKGPNTGGMGAFSPSKYHTSEIADECMKTIFDPTIKALNKEGIKFKGVLYFGLILTENGPKVLEYNARFGDPETQVILPRLKNDIIEIFNAIIDEKLDQINIEWDSRPAACIIAASGGYPGKYQTGYEIEGLEEIEKEENVIVFHAGTKYENERYYTAGGRVLGITALDNTFEMAVSRAYEGISKIGFKDMHYRKDIGV
ncbi:MAG TPA: phosphoribosylamine--glycine ligase [Clostridiaceae bacterium]|jgi:phosphoribosylamine--glycine ligase|nr:phosphoribosylamine--glycine ligase [Clostridiaceae bacterium]